jgi:hypothetical protein
MQLIEEVASDENIEQAFSWLCLKRKEHSHNNDVWNLRRHWQTVKPDLQKQLLDGTYQFTPQQEIRFDTETIELLIDIAIIGILAAIAIPQFNQYKIRGYDAHSKQALKDMHLLCNAYWNILEADAFADIYFEFG